MPYFLIIAIYSAASALPESHLLLSLASFLKSKSYGAGVSVACARVAHLVVLVELGRGDVERDLDLALVAGLLDRLGEDLERLLGRLDVGREAALPRSEWVAVVASHLVADVDRRAAQSRPHSV